MTHNLKSRKDWQLPPKKCLISAEKKKYHKQGQKPNDKLWKKISATHIKDREGIS